MWNTLQPSLSRKHWDTWFLNSSKSKTRLKFMKLGMYHGVASACRGNFFVPFGAGLGISFSQTRASDNKCDGFGRERATFGDETISVSSYCFQIFSSQHRTTGVLCQFLGFSGFAWSFLYINWVFYAFMCIIQIWTTCTCSNAYKLVENSNLCPWLHA